MPPRGPGGHFGAAGGNAGPPILGRSNPAVALPRPCCLRCAQRQHASPGLLCVPASAGSTRCSHCARLNATCVATIPASLRRLLARVLAASDSVAHAGGDATQLASLQRSFTLALRRIRHTTRIGGVGAAAAALPLTYTAVLDRIASALEDLVDVKRYESRLPALVADDEEEEDEDEEGGAT